MLQRVEEGCVICEPESATPRCCGLLYLALLSRIGERGRLPRTLDFKRYPFSFYYLPSSSVHRASRASMLESRSRPQDSMTDLLFIGHKLGNKIVGFFFVELEGLPIVIERKDPS